MSPLALDGLRALVTGTSAGIGERIARAFADAGAAVAVAVNYRSDREHAERIAGEIGVRGGKAVAIQGDVSQPDDCVRLFDAVAQALGGIDVVVASAGVQRDAPFTELSLADWRKVIDVSLTGQFLCAQEACAVFAARVRT